jgi:hypothetical protein
MYSVEYKWTSVEIKVTTTSITTVKLSNKNPQGTLKSSESIQGASFI